VRLDHPEKANGYDQAPVDVEFVSDARKNVLTVPVTALLALRGGGYAVEVVAGNTTEVVPVEVGMFADGLVEVTGKGLGPGDRVGVPSA
jgi:multidrug efflux pump subunit AcrA (membrane-fusion protein)